MHRRALLAAGLAGMLSLGRAVRANEASFLAMGPLVNGAAPLARGLSSWWLCLPQLTGGATLRNLITGQHMTLTAMATPGTATSGVSRFTTRPGGYAEIRFDGTDDYADAGIMANTPTAVGAVTCWALKTALGSRGILIGWENFATDRDGVILTIENTAPGNFRGELCSASNTNNSAANDGIGVVAGVWTHLAMSWTTSLASMYVNGTFSHSFGLSLTPTNNVYPTRMGTSNSGGNFWQGALDDIRLYGRPLAASEIRALYQDSRLGCPSLLTRMPLASVTGTAPQSPTRLFRLLRP